MRAAPTEATPLFQWSYMDQNVYEIQYFLGKTLLCECDLSSVASFLFYRNLPE